MGYMDVSLLIQQVQAEEGFPDTEPMHRGTFHLRRFEELHLTASSSRRCRLHDTQLFRSILNFLKNHYGEIFNVCRRRWQQAIAFLDQE